MLWDEDNSMGLLTFFESFIGILFEIFVGIFGGGGKGVAVVVGAGEWEIVVIIVVKV
jgi:hypothetical protein